LFAGVDGTGPVVVVVVVVIVVIVVVRECRGIALVLDGESDELS
jgi:hypothetical protein